MVDCVGFRSDVYFKRFDQQLFNVFSPLEQMVVDKLSIVGCELSKNPNRFGIDLLVKRNGVVVGGIEVESHGKYWVNQFPFQTVHLLGRKKKYFGLNNFYLLLSKNGVSCLICNTDMLQEKFVRFVDTTKCESEMIFDVPIDQVVCFGWDKVNVFLNDFFGDKVYDWY